MTITIEQTAVVCATGIGAKQCAASFRAGLCGYMQTAAVGRGEEPQVMALVPEAHVAPLHPDLSKLGLGDRARRMLRLGSMAVNQLAPSLQCALPLYLAVPDSRNGRAYADRDFVAYLAQQARLDSNLGLDLPDLLDIDASQCFAHGRAGGLFALQAALEALREGRDAVLVGGLDTPLDFNWLAELEAEQRLLGPAVKDGFIPGEAAAFLLLRRSGGRTGGGRTQVTVAASAHDSGHRYSEAPALGTGLADALEKARTALSPDNRIKSCFAGLNGESFGAKAWGVAHIRHHDLFDPALCFEHPADGFGDVGAAMGPLLIALADETLRTGQRPGPALVWAASDHAPVACACLALDNQTHATNQP